MALDKRTICTPRVVCSGCSRKAMLWLRVKAFLRRLLYSNKKLQFAETDCFRFLLQSSDIYSSNLSVLWNCHLGLFVQSVRLAQPVCIAVENKICRMKSSTCRQCSTDYWLWVSKWFRVILYVNPLSVHWHIWAELCCHSSNDSINHCKYLNYKSELIFFSMHAAMHCQWHMPMVI